MKRHLKSFITDKQFNNHQKYCTHVEAYLILRYAIKHTDIDLLKHSLRIVTVMFQSRNANALKYAQALLFTLHTIDSLAFAVRLQKIILTNDLINLRDESNLNLEIDCFLKLFYNNLKVFQQEKSYFSKNSDELLQS